VGKIRPWRVVSKLSFGRCTSAGSVAKPVEATNDYQLFGISTSSMTLNFGAFDTAPNCCISTALNDQLTSRLHY